MQRFCCALTGAMSWWRLLPMLHALAGACIGLRLSRTPCACHFAAFIIDPLVCYVFSGSDAPREWATRLVGAEASLPLFLFRFLFLWYPVAGCPQLTKRRLDIR